MKKRSPIAVFLLSVVTFGIYSLYWLVKTKGEMNEKGAKIPTAWLIIIPFVSIWWLWKYSEGVEMVTGQKMSGILSFILLWLLSFVGEAIIQDSFNNVPESPVMAATQAPTAPTPDVTPVETTEPSVAPVSDPTSVTGLTGTPTDETQTDTTPSAPTPTVSG
jgi:Domain of unknown function (DUF4234)